jgi:hypothetical protein
LKHRNKRSTSTSPNFTECYRLADRRRIENGRETSWSDCGYRDRHKDAQETHIEPGSPQTDCRCAEEALGSRS